MIGEDKKYVLTMATETTFDELARAVCNMIHDHDEILAFVLRLDEEVADFDFTVELRDKLNEVIAIEEQVSS